MSRHQTFIHVREYKVFQFSFSFFSTIPLRFFGTELLLGYCLNDCLKFFMKDENIMNKESGKIQQKKVMLQSNAYICWLQHESRKKFLNFQSQFNWNDSEFRPFGILSHTNCLVVIYNVFYYNCGKVMQSSLPFDWEAKCLACNVCILCKFFNIWYDLSFLTQFSIVFLEFKKDYKSILIHKKVTWWALTKIFQNFIPSIFKLCFFNRLISTSDVILVWILINRTEACSIFPIIKNDLKI